MDNTITICGNLTRDPELRFTQAGQARCVMGVAVNRRWFSKASDDWEEDVSFFNVVAWSELGEHVAESLSKGARVIITGRLDQRSWENDDGEKRSLIELVADDVGPSMRWATAEVARVPRDSDPNVNDGATLTEKPDVDIPEDEPF